jgi:hypothetical protein
LWERDDEGAFIAAAYALGLPSMALAIELAIYTAQRESDLIGMTEHQLTDQFAIHDARLSERFAGKDGRVLGLGRDPAERRSTPGSSRSSPPSAKRSKLPSAPTARATGRQAASSPMC